MARCDVKNCTKKEYSCGKDGTTRPLWRHLESAHQPFIDTSTILSTEVDKHEALQNVEDPELIEILQYLNPTVQLVKADTIKTTIITLYSLGKQKLRLSTAYYIDENWALKEIIIDFGLLSRKHDGVNIANGFFQILEDYNIVSKFLAITLDNTTNNNVFVRELAIKLKKEMNVSWDPEYLRFQCFNHILNLVAQATLSYNIKNLIQSFAQYLNVLNFLKAFPLNTLTSSHDDFHSYAITHNQWTALEKIGKFLESFKDLMIKMSSSSNSTAFWIILFFNILFNHVEDVASNVNANNKSDFEKDEENTDKLDRYILEKLA
ncbi:7952_t:CDS:2, partial [Gigaspora margarita]